MNKYIAPVAEVELFAIEDVITTSTTVTPTPELGETERDE